MERPMNCKWKRDDEIVLNILIIFYSRHGNGMMGGSTGGSSGRPDVMGMWAVAFSNAVIPK
jgi:hypothetical protein